MRFISIPLFLLFVLTAAAFAPLPARAAEGFDSGAATPAQKTANGFSFGFDLGGDEYTVDIPRDSPAYARFWLAEWLGRTGKADFSYVLIAANDGTLTDIYAEVVLEQAEKKLDEYLLTCNFTGIGSADPRRETLKISSANPLFAKAWDVITEMKAADPGKRAVLVQFEKEMELLAYRIVDQPTAMFLPPEAAPVGPSSPKLAKALKGVWKVDIPKTLAGIGDQRSRDHQKREFERYDSDACFLMLAYDLEDMICKDATMSYIVSGISVQPNGRTIVVDCDGAKQTLTLDSPTELRAIRGGEFWHYKKFEDDPARFYENWRVKEQGGSMATMLLFSRYDAPSGMNMQKVPAAQGTETVAPAPGTGGGLARLNGVWRFNPEASLARFPANAERIRKEKVQKIGFDASTQKMTAYAEHDDKPETLAFLVFADNGNEVELAFGGTGSQDTLFATFVDDNTTMLRLGGFYYVFTREESSAPVAQSGAASPGKGGGLAKLNGVWYFDPEATVARDPANAELIRVEKLKKIGIDASAKKLAVYTDRSDKPDEIGFAVGSDDGNQVTLTLAKGDAKLSFSFVDDNAVALHDGRTTYVFTRTAPRNPHAGFMEKFNGDWTLDIAATKKRSPDFDINDLEACDMRVDAAGGALTMIIRQGGKSPHTDKGVLAVKSSGPQSAEIKLGEYDWTVNFKDNNMLLMAPADKPQETFVFTRVK